MIYHKFTRIKAEVGIWGGIHWFIYTYLGICLTTNFFIVELYFFVPDYKLQICWLPSLHYVCSLILLIVVVEDIGYMVSSLDLCRNSKATQAKKEEAAQVDLGVDCWSSNTWYCFLSVVIPPSWKGDIFLKPVSYSRGKPSIRGVSYYL